MCKLWMIFFIVTAIVFNPLIPIYLRHKSEWMPVDIIFGVVFLVTAFFPKGNSNETKLNFRLNFLITSMFFMA